MLVMDEDKTQNSCDVLVLDEKYFRGSFMHSPCQEQGKAVASALFYEF